MDDDDAIKLYDELVKSPEDRQAQKKNSVPDRRARQSGRGRKTETTPERNGPNP